MHFTGIFYILDFQATKGRTTTMSKQLFSPKQIEQLQQNPHVVKVSERTITYSDTFKKGFNYKGLYTSNKKYDGINLFNNPFLDLTPNKTFCTPQKISNANLDKMFFSVIQNDIVENNPSDKKGIV